ncbi:NUDIX domain-containing protein [Sphaerobacter sp.]|uniref:NUDIX hydrolase n=1 Tax=Sphaerobacter sp. TaxID=2099654 RepID=UPI001D7DB5B9|nr:NUDIX domain-containing protein [Sphaerobacter sp.]MBX5445822.1 NUDIX domain-containing protein [Sphaerobacter sp.]
MPRIVSDIVDVYIFRRTKHGAQFLVVRRRPDLVLGDTWQSVHGKIEPGESAVDAARREVQEHTGLIPTRLYSADYINQFYDHKTDSVVLAPAFAVQVEPTAQPRLSQEYCDYAWCDLEETVARLPLASQRWAARHIYDVIAMGGEEAEFYALP